MFVCCEMFSKQKKLFFNIISFFDEMCFGEMPIDLPNENKDALCVRIECMFGSLGKRL